MKEIGAKAFCECASLRNMRLNEGLEKLGESAFWRSALASIRLSPMLKIIERETFASCGNLNSIVIPNGVEHIGSGCFS